MRSRFPAATSDGSQTGPVGRRTGFARWNEYPIPARTVRHQDENASRFFVGWAHPLTPERHFEVLSGSAISILAIDGDQDKVAGFINAITDGSFAAYIPLLEVLPEYQSRGIGSELVNRMLTQLADFQMIDVICDQDLQPFYERFGLQPWSAMIYRAHQGDLRLRSLESSRG